MVFLVFSFVFVYSFAIGRKTMTTINDIAKEAGVAKSTVSNVFTGKKYVSPETASLILEIAKKNHYFPNFYASSLPKGKGTNIIGLFLESNESNGVYQPYYNSLIESLLVNGRKNGFGVLVYFGLDCSEVFERLRPGKSPINSAVLVSPLQGDEREKDLDQSLIPYVVIGNPGNGNSGYVASIDTDNVMLVKKIASEMLSSGCHKVCLINSHASLTISTDRVLGLNMAAKPNQSLIFYSNHSTKEDGYYYSSRAIREGADGIICANCDIAKGVYEAAKDFNKVIGKDIKVFSLGYTYSLDGLLTPRISYARQDYDEFGKRAVECLSQSLDGKASKQKILINSDVFYLDSFSPVKSTN